MAYLCLYNITSDCNTAVSCTDLQRYVKRVVLCSDDATITHIDCVLLFLSCGPYLSLWHGVHLSVMWRVIFAFSDPFIKGIHNRICCGPSSLKCDVTILCQPISSPSEYLHDLSVMEHFIAILCDDIARIVTSRKFTYSAILMYFHILSLWLKHLNNQHIQDMYIMFEVWPGCPCVSLMLIIFFNYVNRADVWGTVHFTSTNGNTQVS